MFLTNAHLIDIYLIQDILERFFLITDKSLFNYKYVRICYCNRTAILSQTDTPKNREFWILCEKQK